MFITIDPCVPLSWLIIFLVLVQIAYSLIEEQEGRKRLPDDYISFVGLLADPRYCGIIYVVVSIKMFLLIMVSLLLLSKLFWMEMIINS